jgi:hypothetical protein
MTVLRNTLKAFTKLLGAKMISLSSLYNRATEYLIDHSLPPSPTHPNDISMKPSSSASSSLSFSPLPPSSRPPRNRELCSHCKGSHNSNNNYKTFPHNTLTTFPFPTNNPSPLRPHWLPLSTLFQPHQQLHQTPTPLEPTLWLISIFPTPLMKNYFLVSQRLSSPGRVLLSKPWLILALKCLACHLAFSI